MRNVSLNNKFTISQLVYFLVIRAACFYRRFTKECKISTQMNVLEKKKISGKILLDTICHCTRKYSKGKNIFKKP